MSALPSIAASTDRIHEIPPRVWAYAQLVGEARRQSNEVKQAKRHNRGRAKNYLGHVQGAFCELFLLGLLVKSCDSASSEPVSYLRRHMFNPGGGTGAADADLAWDESPLGARFGLDVKSFDCAPNKRFFAINAEKHDKLAGRASYYYCALAPPLAKRIYVSQLVPHSEVDSWPVGQLGRYGDPSRQIPIGDFLRQWCPSAPDPRDLASDTRSEDEISELAATADIRDRMLRFVPSLNGYV